MAISKTIKDKKTTFHCDICFRNISNLAFLTCNDCKYDLCGRCFTKNYKKEKYLETSEKINFKEQNCSASIVGGCKSDINKECLYYDTYRSLDAGTSNLHKNSTFEHSQCNHRYRVVANLNKSCFNASWSVLEELLFINGLINFGIGNFVDISSIITNKSEADVKMHFFETLGIQNNTYNERDNNPKKSLPNDSAVLSYMSKRKDFESEIYNEYEAIMCGLVFDPNDNELDKALKEFMLSNFEFVFKQRAIWKNYVIDRGLINVNEIRLVDQTEFGTFVAKHRWALQYLSKNDFNTIMSGIYREKVLEEEINKLSASELIDKVKLEDIKNFIGANENRLCEKLKMSHELYFRLKVLAIECYTANRMLNNEIYRLFPEKERARIEIIYNWFKKHNFVHE